ncbi:hypothetical protein CN311_06290 [Mesorhizobium sanjuanii]|uniref:Uncharacterized protein n=1 Tax=Mesorhizobium sanjuanii TaxID=2037900 RepID=A0A2A6FK56_9HYPH|nr:hypothetical protein CN311_06290 [Mesorhizobium sanjuanii]
MLLAPDFDLTDQSIMLRVRPRARGASSFPLADHTDHILNGSLTRGNEPIAADIFAVHLDRLTI